MSVCYDICRDEVKYMKKNDWFLAAGILIAAAVILLIQLMGAARGELTVSVTVDGVLYGTYSLAEDIQVDINETNRLIIKDESVRMEWADCPDQVCVNHVSISRDGESIICLPNRVVVSINGTESAGLDGIAQ